MQTSSKEITVRIAVVLQTACNHIADFAVSI